MLRYSSGRGLPSKSTPLATKPRRHCFWRCRPFDATLGGCRLVALCATCVKTVGRTKWLPCRASTTAINPGCTAPPWSIPVLAKIHSAAVIGPKLNPSMWR